MKSKKYLHILFVLIATSFAAHAVIQNEYCPFIKNASWLYDDGSHVYVSEVTDFGSYMNITVTNVNQEGYAHLYVNSSEFGWTQGSNSEYILMRRIPPYPLLSFPLTNGKQWSNQIPSGGYPVNFTCTIISTDSIVTAYSTTYSNCVSVDIAFDFPLGHINNTYITNRVVHFAPNVGCVRRDDMWNDGSDSSIQLRSYTIGSGPPTPPGPAYEVWDFSINVQYVIHDKGKYKLKPGIARGWIVTHEDGGATAFIYDRSGHEQLPCMVQTEYYEESESKGLASMLFNIVFNNAEYSGVVLGKYTKNATSLMGSGAGMHTGNDSVLKNMRIKRNKKMSAEINEVSSAREYMEAAVGKKVRDPSISLNWNWLAP